MSEHDKDSIEQFATLCARASCGPVSDEDGWTASRSRWLPLLASADAPEVGARFAVAYARALLGAGQATQEDDRTLELEPHAHFGAALPFRSRVAPEVAAGEDATLEVSPAARPVPPALPFAPAPAPRRGRLQHFDTQTGKPLPEPIWVDEPTPPKR
jgi:hypothetical protein